MKKYEEMKQQAVEEMNQYGLSAEDIVFHVHKCSEECKASGRAKVFYILCAVALSSIPCRESFPKKGLSCMHDK